MGQPTIAANTTKSDDNADGNSYYGDALPGTATSAAAWSIQRVSTSGTVVTTVYADGDANYDNIWDNRTSLTYP
jgi:hypothetical protein